MSQLPPVYNRFVVALAAGIFLAVAWSYAYEQRPDSAIRSGDFPAFYTLASIASSSEPQQLYNISVQQELQRTLWPQMAGSMLPAAYPPYVAWILQPATLLSPERAKEAWSVLSIVVLLITARVIGHFNPALYREGPQTTILLISFLPSLLGAAGGQASALSALLACVVCGLLATSPSPKRDLLLGISAGAWMFKPHFAFPFVFAAILQRRWLAVSSYTVVLLLLSCMAFRLLGLSWLEQWLLFARDFAHLDLLSNSYQMSGVVALASSLAGPNGLGSSVEVTLVGASLAALFGSILLVLRLGPSDAPLILPSLVALLAPVVNFYDLSMVWASGLMIFNPRRSSHRWSMVACVAAGASCTLLRSNNVPGLMLLLNVMIGGWLCLQLANHRKESPVTDSSQS